MQLKVTLPGEFTVFNLEDSATFIAAISRSKSYRTEGWGKDQKKIIVEEAPTLTIVPDDFCADIKPVEPIVKLQESLRAAETRWVDYYNKSNELEEELKAAKAELASIRAAVAPPSPPTPANDSDIL